jgi:hypothetical protein
MERDYHGRWNKGMPHEQPTDGCLAPPSVLQRLHAGGHPQGDCHQDRRIHSFILECLDGIYRRQIHALVILQASIQARVSSVLSNQIVQICDDMFKFRNKAAHLDLQSPLSAATRFAWVTLQSLGAMEGYLKDKLCLHQAINSTFICFLTRHMANQTSAGLKGTVEGFENKVMDLNNKVSTLTTDCGKKVTQDMFNCFETKLNKIVDVNNLKKPPGGGN